MSGETTLTVIGNLTNDPELRYTPVSREFDKTEGTPVDEIGLSLTYTTADLGYSQAPIVQNNPDDQDHWSGLRRDKIVQAAMTHSGA